MMISKRQSSHGHKMLHRMLWQSSQMPEKCLVRLHRNHTSFLPSPPPFFPLFFILYFSVFCLFNLPYFSCFFILLSFLLSSSLFPFFCSLIFPFFLLISPFLPFLLFVIISFVSLPFFLYARSFLAKVIRPLVTCGCQTWVRIMRTSWKYGRAGY